MIFYVYNEFVKVKENYKDLKKSCLNKTYIKLEWIKRTL